MSDDGVRSRSFAGAVAAGAAAVAVMSGVAKADATVRASSIEGPVAYNTTLSQFGGKGGDAFTTSGGTRINLRLTMSSNQLVLDTGTGRSSGSGGGGSIENVSRVAGIMSGYNYAKSLNNLTGTGLQTSGGDNLTVGVGIDDDGYLTITGGV